MVTKASSPRSIDRIGPGTIPWTCAFVSLYAPTAVSTPGISRALPARAVMS